MTQTDLINHQPININSMQNISHDQIPNKPIKPNWMRPITRKPDAGFAMWSHNLGYASSLSAIISGFFAILYYYECTDCGNRPEAQRYLWSELWAGIAVSVMGVLAFLFEYYCGLQQCLWIPGETTTRRSPLRVLFYLLLSCISCFSVPTLLVSYIFLSSTLVNFISITLREYFKKPLDAESYCLCSIKVATVQDDPKTDDNDGMPTSNTSTWQRFKRWWIHQREIGNLGEVFLGIAYTAGNVALWLAYVIKWVRVIQADQAQCSPGQEYDCLSVYAAFAKGFGGTLNLNCTFILLPVLKSLLQQLNNLYQHKFSHSISDYLPPLRKNIVFHKFVALFIFIGTAGHVLFHLVNLMKSPEATIARFTWNPIISGCFVTFAMACIYTGAQKRIKHEQYEVFWTSHHFYAVFYVFLLAHAPKFWMWGGWVLVVFVLEKFYRRYQRNRTFFVTRVVYEAPVLRMYIYPGTRTSFHFREGQYVYLCIPTVKEDDWHPFTISSASESLAHPEDPFFSLHIRVMDVGSWTHKTMMLFRDMAHTRYHDGTDYSVSLQHLDSRGNPIKGKCCAPDGKPLIMVDGPHAAPVQQYSNYNQVLLIGAGIGLTPSASILESVLYYKWSKNFGPKHLHFCWVVRHNEIKSFRWFVELLVRLETRIAHDMQVGNISQNTNTFKAHIFVTSAPKRGQDAPRIRSLQLDPGDIHVQPIGRRVASIEMDRLSYSRVDLENAMLSPKVNASSFVEMNSTSSNVFGNIHVWNGRPNWDAVFAATKEHVIGLNTPMSSASKKKTQRVGVCFCGAAQIGKDLKSVCSESSSLSEGVLFTYHKENF